MIPDAPRASEVTRFAYMVESGDPHFALLRQSASVQSYGTCVPEPTGEAR
jgi:hypothetical protein